MVKSEIGESMLRKDIVDKLMNNDHKLDDIAQEMKIDIERLHQHRKIEKCLEQVKSGDTILGIFFDDNCKEDEYRNICQAMVSKGLLSFNQHEILIPVSFLLGGYKWREIERQYLDENTLDEIEIVGRDDIGIKDIKIVGNVTLEDVVDESEPNRNDGCFDDPWDNGGKVFGKTLCRSVIEIYQREEPKKKKQKLG